jgi:hypothetical protein
MTDRAVNALQARNHLAAAGQLIKFAADEWPGSEAEDLLRAVDALRAKIKAEAAEPEEIPWPTEGGIWMAWMQDGWFPLRAMPMRDDLPTREEIEYHEKIGARQLRKVLAIVVQFPKSPNEWPYTFQKCHPCSRFRRPTPEENAKARHFYSLPPIS